MREISCLEIIDTLARLCIEANYYLGDDVLEALCQAREKEVSPVGREIFDQILQNEIVFRNTYLITLPFSVTDIQVGGLIFFHECGGS